MVACAYGHGPPPALVLPRVSRRLSIGHAHEREGRCPVMTNDNVRASAIPTEASAGDRLSTRPELYPIRASPTIRDAWRLHSRSGTVVALLLEW